MPTYEYHCDACERDMDIRQSMKDDPLTACPECGEAGKIRRKISGGAGIIFKGSGFYETDYKRVPEKKEGESKGEGKEGGGEKKDSGGGEKKPAAGEGTAKSGGGDAKTASKNAD